MTRRRYRWNEETQQLEELSADVEVTPRLQIQTGNHYEGLRATDGTRIDTRKRHSEYMRREGVGLASDFRKTIAEAPKRRAAEEKAARREVVARVTHALENRRR